MKQENKIVSFFNALFVDSRHVSLTLKLEGVVQKMNPTEKIFFYIISGLVVISGLILLYQTNNSFLVEVPGYGGKLTEGIVGPPRFINPILVISDTDKDLSSLIYSGLIRQKIEGGFAPDLAETYEISQDGTVYYFKIREDAYFHDGKPVTADDIVFTVSKILDPVIKSPKRSSWEGVVVEKVSEKEIRFILSKPYSPFIESLTTGILPKHIWENATSEEFPFSEFNINPVGSGPYKIKKISRNSGGIPTTIALSPWDKYVLGKPKVSLITLKFFQNEAELLKAYEDGVLDSASGLSPFSYKKISGESASQATLPRVFGVFFNQNQAAVFLNKEVRQALDIAAPKARIVSEVLYGAGKPLSGPTPGSTENDAVRSIGNIEEAKLILQNAGWQLNEESGMLEKKTKSGTEKLAFSIATSDIPELKQTAEILKEAWEAAGASVEIKVFESGDLSQNIIRGRKYEALLFGEVVGPDSDLYSFWHSSQRNDPGLNISLYANITVDKALEEIQKSADSAKNNTLKETVLTEIKKDIPAIFLFSPTLSYISPTKVKNISLKKVSFPNERFLNVSEWYIETDKVWKFLANNQ